MFKSSSLTWSFIVKTRLGITRDRERPSFASLETARLGRGHQRSWWWVVLATGISILGVFRQSAKLTRTYNPKHTQKETRTWPRGLSPAVAARCGTHFCIPFYLQSVCPRTAAVNGGDRLSCVDAPSVFDGNCANSFRLVFLLFAVFVYMFARLLCVNHPLCAESVSSRCAGPHKRRGEAARTVTVAPLTNPHK